LDLRNALDFRNHISESGEVSDHHLRDFRRMTGAVQMMDSCKSVPGPYTQESRAKWLAKLLSAQTYIRKNGPEEVRHIELITLAELQEIRRIWVVDKHELEDSLPQIFRQVTGEQYPGKPLDDNLAIGESEMHDLEEICRGDRLHYELTRELLSLTRQQRTSARRSGLFEQLEKSFRKYFYDDREDAIARAQMIADERKNRVEEIKYRSRSAIYAPEKVTTLENDR